MPGPTSGRSGVVLHEMLAGTRPFTGKSGSEVTSAILRDPPPPLPARVPAGLQTIVRQCLEKDPRRRYQRAGELRAAVQAAGAGTEVSSRQDTPRDQSRPLDAGAGGGRRWAPCWWSPGGGWSGHRSDQKNVASPADAPTAREEAADPGHRAAGRSRGLRGVLKCQPTSTIRWWSGLGRAVTEYERAVAIDPDYATAHAGLAFAYALAPFWRRTDSRERTEREPAGHRPDLPPGPARVRPGAGAGRHVVAGPYGEGVARPDR